MSRVETFVSKINTAVHLRQEQEKLCSVLTKFDTYNPLEAVSFSDEVERVRIFIKYKYSILVINNFYI